MASQFTAIPTLLHTSLANLDISLDKTTVMGFGLDTTFSCHKKAFEALQAQGFSSPPAWTNQSVNRFLLEKNPAGNGGFELAVGFEYAGDLLENVKVILSRDIGTSEGPENVVSDMQAALMHLMGMPNLLVDNTAALSKQSINTSNPSVIYGGFWSGSQAVLPETTKVTDSTQFFQAICTLGHGGALATITGISGSVMVCVDFFSEPRQTNYFC